MGENRTIARLWQDAVARNREGAAYLVQHGDHWHDVGWAEAAERVENLANGLLARGVRKGESFAIFARTIVEWSLFDFALAQVGAVVTPIYPEQLAPRHGVHPRPLGVRRGAVWRRAAGGLDRRAARRAATTPLPADDGRPGGARGRGRTVQGREPDGARRRDRRRRRGRSLHAPVHLRHDRAAEGVHGLPPQLLRDGGGDRPSAALRATTRT